MPCWAAMNMLAAALVGFHHLCCMACVLLPCTCGPTVAQPGHGTNSHCQHRLTAGDCVAGCFYGVTSCMVPRLLHVVPLTCQVAWCPRLLPFVSPLPRAGPGLEALVVLPMQALFAVHAVFWTGQKPTRFIAMFHARILCRRLAGVRTSNCSVTLQLSQTCATALNFTSNV